MYDVAIIGFGPTGAVAAGMLGKMGVKTLVLDRSETIYDKPRAIALDHEIMRVFQHLGVARAIAPYVAPYPASEYRGVDGRIIKRLDAAPPPNPLGWPPNLSFTQPPVEAALRAGAQVHDSVHIRLGVEVEGLAPSTDFVTLALRGESGLTSEQARYVIACDGANSTVRRLAKLDLEDLDFDEPWLVVDVTVSPEALDRLPTVNVQYCEPSRPATYVVGPGNHRRWEIMLHEDEDPLQFADESAVWKMLERWVTPADAAIWRSATYRFHALVASTWHQGHVFIAGDAAHQQPPFLGQGMCQGVRDAVNLTWKLEAVLGGRANASLLDTYEVERSEHVRTLTNTIKALGRFVCERDLTKAIARDEKLIAEMGGSVKTALRQDLIPSLVSGFLSSVQHAAVGTMFPQPRIAPKGELMDDNTECGLRLIVCDAVLDEDVAFVQRKKTSWPPSVVRICGIETTQGASKIADILDLTELDNVASDWFSRHQCVAALIRPDNYVFGVARDTAAINRLLDEADEKLAGQRAPSCVG